MPVVAALADNRNPQSLASRLRQKRFAVFLQLVSCLSRPIRILDVGRTQEFWEVLGFGEQTGVSVTVTPVCSPNPNTSQNSCVLPTSKMRIGRDRQETSCKNTANRFCRNLDASDWGLRLSASAATTGIFPDVCSARRETPRVDQHKRTLI